MSDLAATNCNDCGCGVSSKSKGFLMAHVGVTYEWPEMA